MQLTSSCFDPLLEEYNDEEELADRLIEALETSEDADRGYLAELIVAAEHDLRDTLTEDDLRLLGSIAMAGCVLVGRMTNREIRLTPGVN